VNPTKGKKIPK